MRKGQEKRRSPMTKKEVYRQLLQQVVLKQIPFRYVVNDVWFASAENMNFVVHNLKRHFVIPLKTNRKLSQSLQDKLNGQ